MFERFTPRSWTALEVAIATADQLGCPKAGSDHLVAGLAADPESVAARLLREHGADAGRISEALLARYPERRLGDVDADVLRELGIDLEEVRARVEDTFGRGALDAKHGRRRAWQLGFVRAAPGELDADLKRVVRNALGEAKRLHDSFIGTEHLLLGVLTLDFAGRTLLADLGVDLPALARSAEHRPAA